MNKPIDLASAVWPEIEPVAADRLLLVPVGSCEQHGPHLPYDTDTRIAVALVTRVADLLPDQVVVAPAVAFGSSGEHADFPGTISIGTEALTTVLIEIGRSADAFRGVVFVNGHGGNAEALDTATRTLQSESRNVRTWSWSLPSADAHAGRTETSLLLAIAPEAVHLDAAEPGRTEPLAELIGDLRDQGVRVVSPNGILGDPTGASGAEGQTLLGRCISAMRTWIAEQPT